jgi:hypothetical protein
MEQQFKVGDRVVCIDVGCTELSLGKEYIVQAFEQSTGWNIGNTFDWVGVYMDNISPCTYCWFHPSRFKLSDKTPKQLAKEHLDALTMKKFKISEEYRLAVAAYEHFDKIAALEKAIENALFSWKNSVRVEKMCHQILLREEAKLHNMTYCN